MCIDEEGNKVYKTWIELHPEHTYSKKAEEINTLKRERVELQPTKIKPAPKDPDIEKKIKDVIATGCCNHQATGTECYMEDEERLITKEHKHYCVTCDTTCPLFNVLDNPESDIRVFMNYNPDICLRFTRAIVPAHKDINDYLYNNKRKQGSTRKCAVCGKTFFGIGRQKYCSDRCKKKALYRQQSEYRRKKG